VYRTEPISSERPASYPTPERVLAVIPCLNERAHIGKLLDDLLADAGDLDLLIAVADGGSTDGTQEIVASISAADDRVRLIHNPKRIQSAGVNLAAQTFGAGRKWLVRIDAHAAYPGRFIATLIAEARRTSAASVVVAMKSEGETCFQRAAAVAQNSVLGTGGAVHRLPGGEGFVDHGHHALFDLAQFERVGGYDDTLSHNEDAEFDVRLAQAGGKIWLTRAIEVTYFPRAHPAALYQQYVNYGRGRARTLRSHRMRPKVRQFLPACVLPTVLAVAASPWIPLALGPAVVWTGACVLSGVVLGIQQRRRCAFASGIAAMIIHLGWSIGFWRELVFGDKRPQAVTPT
jgi:succinoglycan biosynthesis protein ExoA